MKKIKILYVFALLFSVISCSNKDEKLFGYADDVIGNYHGTIYYGQVQVPCNTVITKTGDTEIRLTIIMGGTNTYFGEITVFSSTNFTYVLSYSNKSGGYIDGKVEGTALTYSINSGVVNYKFTGSR